MAIGERLRQVHHGLVTGRIAMRVKLADYVADGPGALARLGGGRQPQFAHGVDNAALHRLEPIGQMRQGPVQDDVHGVVQVRLLGVLRQRLCLRVVARHQGKLRTRHQPGTRAFCRERGQDALVEGRMPSFPA